MSEYPTKLRERQSQRHLRIRENNFFNDITYEHIY